MTRPPAIAAAITALEEERRPLAARLDALDLALSNLRQAFPHEAPAERQKARKATAARKPVGRKKAQKPAAEAPSAANGRRDELLRRLRMNKGVGTSKELRASISAYAAMSDAEAAKAFSNDMYRLKAAGLVNRTGHTWSLVGVGAEAA